ncbi:MAG: hypothetical protein KF850_34250, partial [Labilithrix sp.]|nr:hypothetical protein [Labilithrix sp.]
PRWVVERSVLVDLKGNQRISNLPEKRGEYTGVPSFHDLSRRALNGLSPSTKRLQIRSVLSEVGIERITKGMPRSLLQRPRSGRSSTRERLVGHPTTALDMREQPGPRVVYRMDAKRGPQGNQVLSATDPGLGRRLFRGQERRCPDP